MKTLPHKCQVQEHSDCVAFLLCWFFFLGGGVTKSKYKSSESRLFDLSTALDFQVGPPGSS